MTRFGLITEGVTDQQVIENIVYGVFDEGEAEVNPLQPLGDETYRGQLQSFGNWELVFQYCASPEFAQAFQFNDFVIVQVDTDRCQDTHYDISRRHSDGSDLTPEEVIERVREKIIGLIGEQTWATFGQRVIFAISEDSIECWILVLHAQNDRKTRYKNCANHLQRELQRLNIRVNVASKNPQQYDKASQDFSNKRRLREVVQYNVGLRIFVTQLENVLPPTATETEDDV